MTALPAEGAALPVAILGASGYTGAELIRLTARHPRLTIAALAAERAAGQHPAESFPHLTPLALPQIARIEDLDLSAMAAVFLALPHGVTQSVVAALPPGPIIIDLSADFRLQDPAAYAEWYGHAHQAEALQAEAVYGLTEIHRAAIRQARLIANPGCYPTASLLPLIPLLRAGLIAPDRITIDAASGISGAGRSLRQNLLFTEAGESHSAYGLGRHRHMPEIEQELSRAAGAPVTIGFVPHLLPVARGMLATIHVEAPGGAAGLRACLADAYAAEPFVHLLPEGLSPETAHLRGTNHCFIQVVAERRPDRVVLLSAIDNLGKGAAGQAVQNLNCRMGWPESLGLDGVAAFP